MFFNIIYIYIYILYPAIAKKHMECIFYVGNISFFFLFSFFFRSRSRSGRYYGGLRGGVDLYGTFGFDIDLRYL